MTQCFRNVPAPTKLVPTVTRPTIPDKQVHGTETDGQKRQYKKAVSGVTVRHVFPEVDMLL